MKSRYWISAYVSLAAAVVLAVCLASTACGPDSVRASGHIVVAEFDNRTDDQSLDLLGSRIGHWITHGLQHAAVPVTPWDFAIESWEYVQGELAAGRVNDPVSALAEETGAGVVVSGAIHPILPDSIELRLNLTDVVVGRSLGDIDPLRVAISDAEEIVMQSQRRVMECFAPMIGEDLQGFIEQETIGSPPTLDAYVAYREGELIFIEEEGVSEDAVELFRRAAQLDNTWTLPLVRMHAALRPFQFAGRRPRFNTGVLMDSVQTVLEGLSTVLSPYERAIVESEQGRHNVLHARRLPALRRAAELAPGSQAARSLAGYLLFHDRPSEAVNLMLALGRQRKWTNDLHYWLHLGDAFRRLGEHERGREAARECRRLFPDEVRCVVSEATSLAAMGRAIEFAAVMDEVRPVPDVWQRPYLIVDPIEFLIASGHAEAALLEVERSIDLFESRASQDNYTRFNYGRALLVAGRLDEAQEVFDGLTEVGFLDTETRGIRGVIAALRGDTATAMEDVRWSEADNDERATFNAGMILGALGETDRAIEMMRQAIEHGLQIIPWTTVRVELGSLRDHPEVQELFRPQG